MESQIILRELEADDGVAISDLTAISSDGGKIRFSPIYQMDPYQAVQAFHGDVAGVAACAPDRDGFVGLALVRFGQCYFEGSVRPYALLNSLIVHPDYRCRGIATQLANWRIEYARQRYGDDVILIANIQSGNQGSLKTASKWFQQVIGPVTYLPMKANFVQPTPPSSFIVRPALEEEFEEIIASMDRFYRHFCLYQPVKPDEMRESLTHTPFETPFRHYWVAVDGQGCIQAGIGILEEYRLRLMQIKDMPPTYKLLNQFLQIVPKDNISREITLDRIWFKPGQQKAARFLLDSVRWEWRERVNNVGIAYDPAGPLRELLPTQPWTPKTTLNVAVLGPKQVPQGRLVSPIF